MSMLQFSIALLADHYNEDELPMTMQVGLVGCDGIVLVSDSLTYTDPPERIRNRPHVVRTTSTLQKIRISRSGKMAVSCAWDMRQALALADAINDGFAEELKVPVNEQLRNLALQEMTRNEWRSAECLIVRSQPGSSRFSSPYSV